ncbi:hypothetical protein DENSPDRAFT_833103 [Dentipellis sp. KUC8613]|nr:hypothetical protein DENSPDRAFT_833103 [Dentipellis sp. KUC8613]
MPKVPSTKNVSPSANSATNPIVLKRNQACHQCRRRKLKCDAQRPCSTCVRSHAHAVSHAPAGVLLPDHPECTFDEVAGQSVPPEPAKNRYEKLENRINELEAMLREQASPNGSKPSPTNVFTSENGTASNTSFSESGMLSSFSLMNDAGTSNSTPAFTPPSGIGASNSPDAALAFHPSMGSMGDMSNMALPASTAHITSSPASAAPSPPSPYGYQVTWQTWPPNLPQPHLLRHLVEIFFAFHPHAGRLFHGPSFMSSLTLPPTHPKFPSTAVLHAICAVASMYTVAVVPTPQPNLNEMAPDEIFNDKFRDPEETDSFAEQQIKFACREWDRHIAKGSRLLEHVQASIICNWWYWCHARWVELFMSSARTLRAAVPLGLNTCAPFQSIAESLRAPSILPPAEDIVEEETRRNTFWLAYVMERQHGCSNGWALSLDDQDVTQLLPVKGDLFDFGTPAPREVRQWSQTKDVILSHPEDQTDSFSLYIKGNMLLSRVKTYNLRFRSKRFRGESDVAYDPAYANFWEQYSSEIRAKDLAADPRRTSAFVEIDRIAMSFRASFPHHLKNPMPDGVVDSHLYTAHLIPHVAIILLHDPHAHVGSAGCMSAYKILEAARAILDLIYAVQSTSYDITLLDYFCAFCWFMAGRVLVRFWHAAQDAKSEEQMLTLRAEVEYIASAIAKFGERIPLAHRYSRMLNDIAFKTCGQTIFFLQM